MAVQLRGSVCRAVLFRHCVVSGAALFCCVLFSRGLFRHPLLRRFDVFAMCDVRYFFAFPEAEGIPGLKTTVVVIVVVY